MRQKAVQALISLSLVILGASIFSVAPAQADVFAQQPTVSIATVTGTPTGPVVRVNADEDKVNVRSGPGTHYAIIGIAVPGQIMAALGKSVQGEWIQVAYPGVPGGKGWIYSALVTLIKSGELPIVEPPPTPTPLVTPTIDPILAATYIVEAPATRVPTFTPPVPLVMPTMPADSAFGGRSNFPMGLAILIFGVAGLMGVLVAVIRGR